MKAEEARKLTDQALARLADALAQGKSEALTRYLDTMARFHRYSFGNIMLILAQKPDATHVAGFNTWKKVNRWVKKGEHGIVIIAPMVIRREDEQAKDGEPQKSVMRFRGVYVFDVSQTEGDPLPEVHSVKGDPGPCTERLKGLIAARGITLGYEQLPPGVSGLSSGGGIRIQTGLTPADEFAVLVHELAHEMLHHGQGSTRGTKTVRETEAEAVAFVVTHAVGLDTNSAAADYIQMYQGSKETLAESLDCIQKTAASIIEAVTAADEAAAAA
jgi:hypothetical protein